jgi:hypothetical protein
MNCNPSRVIPAKAGIQDDGTSLALDPRFRGDDNEEKAEVSSMAGRASKRGS